ncbi:MAG: phospho-sugar mutase [Flavobacteriales bacterium]|jgi:phosphoglucomutase|nr:phospho-sugar mutase [Flavobacteriales bacterium]MBQ5814855.1 phospho-sugar mutase [Flavobacteriales bacterium]
MDIKELSMAKAEQWLSEKYDEATRTAVAQMIENDPQEVVESFYKDLEFGTGGMRGIMGVGTNRMNKYTIGAATQGLADYLKEQFPGEEISVVIGCDVRHNSEEFSRLCAEILSANGIKAYLFDSFRPTPEISFAIRYLGSKSGIIITASHNPPKYNGYKAYWEDGSQVVPPHDTGIIDRVSQVKVEDIKFTPNEDLIEIIGEKVDAAFVEASVANGSCDTTGRDDFKLVYTPIHGTSFKAMIPALAKAGFNNVLTVEEQMVPSGDFPTVKSPNPEDPAALAMATALADANDADMVVGTDPDADRIGVAVRNLKGELQLLNGNECNTVLITYLLERWKKAGKLDGKQFIGSTIVTSDIFFKIAELYGVKCKVGLTGFKWIADMIRRAEGVEQFIGGGEESFGFLVGDFVRDKDSITTTVLACEVAAVAKANGSSFFEELLKVYEKTGMYRESLVNITREGLSGAQEIKAMMDSLRENPLKSIDGSPVVKIDDYKTSISRDMIAGTESAIEIPKSDVLIYYTADGTKIAARPSGTEPKIKFYFSVNTPFAGAEHYDETVAVLEEKLARIKKEMDL